MSVAGGSAGRFGLIVTVALLAFLHYTLSPLLDTLFIRPNLLVCGVLVAARAMRPGGAAALGFLLGLLEDALAVSHFGLATLLLVLVAYLGSQTRELFLGEEPLFMGTYLLVGTWVYEVASFLLLGVGSDPLSLLFVRAPLDGVLTGAVGYLTLPIVQGR